jgi:hypothetical protein
MRVRTQAVQYGAIVFAMLAGLWLASSEPKPIHVTMVKTTKEVPAQLREQTPLEKALAIEAANYNFYRDHRFTEVGEANHFVKSEPRIAATN